MEYKIGIMMIGSLYWDLNNIRAKWREERLENEEFDVFAPIRYGRYSKTNTYTMVFSQLCKRKDYGLGSVKVLTCKNKATNIEDIIEEAEFLWAAESKKEKSGGFWATWGSIGLLCNPKSIFPGNYFTNWSSTTEKEQDYGNISHTKTEKPILGNNGFLNISWPINKNTDENLPFDIILATATDPTIRKSNNSYPHTKEIAEAWKNDNNGNDKYFWNNRKYGIHTFQDNTIINLLK